MEGGNYFDPSGEWLVLFCGRNRPGGQENDRSIAKKAESVCYYCFESVEIMQGLLQPPGIKGSERSLGGCTLRDERTSAAAALAVLDTLLNLRCGVENQHWIMCPSF